MKETSEQIKARIERQREDIIDQLMISHPDLRIKREQFGVKLVYYTASYHNGKVQIGTHTRHISHTQAPNLDGLFLTPEQAQNAINQHLPVALIKFEACQSAFNSLKSEMGFDVGYIVEGDTHGIDYDTMYIDFKMGGFEFRFEIQQ